MAFLFDTDVLSKLLRRRRSTSLVRRFDVVPPEAQAMSAITYAEMLYGAPRRGMSRMLVEIAELADRMPVLPFDRNAASIFAGLKTDLERRGLPLAEADLRIAAIALANDLTLVTGNTRHFARVPGLRVENWLEAE